MRTIPARSVQPGMTITVPGGTPGVVGLEPVTFTVATGHWCDVDENGNELEPATVDPTHVGLGDEGPEHGAYVCIPVEAEVHVVREGPHAFETAAERVRQGDQVLDPRDGSRWVVLNMVVTGQRAKTVTLYPATTQRDRLRLVATDRITVVKAK